MGNITIGWKIWDEGELQKARSNWWREPNDPDTEQPDRYHTISRPIMGVRGLLRTRSIPVLGDKAHSFNQS